MTHTFSSISLCPEIWNQEIWSRLLFGNLLFSYCNSYHGSAICFLSSPRKAVNIKELAQEFSSTSLKSLKGKLQCHLLQTQSVIERRYANKSFTAGSTILPLHTQSWQKQYSVRPDAEKRACVRQCLLCWTKSSRWNTTMSLWFPPVPFSAGNPISWCPVVQWNLPPVISPTVPFHSDILERMCFRELCTALLKFSRGVFWNLCDRKFRKNF